LQGDLIRKGAVRQIADNPLQNLQNQTKDNPAIIAGALARSALLFEVDLTPKPGLVDAENNGSHPDLSRELFYLSAEVLEPYFSQYWQIGADKSLPAIFPALRSLGLEAEAEMFAATGERNTHKGAHFCLGLVLAAAGYLYHQTDWYLTRTYERERLNDKVLLYDKERLPETTVAEPELKHPGLTPEVQISETTTVKQKLRLIELAAELLSFVPRICGDLIAADLDDPGGEYQATAGAESFRRYGIGGIRAEVSSGFPSITKYGLHMLKAHVCRQPTFDATGAGLLSDRKLALDYLMTLITRVEDTTLIKRGGLAGLRYAQSAATKYLDYHTHSNSWEAALRRLDADFQARNLSPGGAADLLAVTYFTFSLIIEIL
jgi:triphosphoribosyl-dephospho-CoA synthetase